MIKRYLRGRVLPAALVGLLVLLLAALVGVLAYLSPHTAGRKVGLSELTTLSSQQSLTRAVFLDEDSRIEVRQSDGTKLWTAYPASGALTSSLITTLRAGGAEVVVDQQPTKQKVRFLGQYVLPVLLLADLFALMVGASRGGGAAAGIEKFGSLSGGRAGSTARFTDVGGAQEAVAELAEVRDYLANPEPYKTVGAAPPKGVLLFGPPGTGKTLLARAVAGEAGVPFFSVAGAQFVESLVGVGAARVRDLFARVREVAPAIVFIDELDAVGRRRGTGASTGGTDERESTLNQLLVEMDGFDPGAGIVVIAATNRPDILDAALTRPGRFDRHVTVERPDVAGRTEILKVHGRGKPLEAGVDLDDLAHRTPGFTGADLANVMNEAALLVVRTKATTITQPLLIEAVDRVRNGPQRRGRLLSADELHAVSVHECGHAVVASLVGQGVSRISVLPKGASLGSTTVADEGEVQLSAALKDRLTVLLAGRAAETVLLGDVSTASELDLQQATALARDMVSRWGMSAAVGAVRWAAPGSAVDLGDATVLDEVSDATHQQVDAEISALIAEAGARAEALLRKNKTALTRIAATLAEAETLEVPALAEALQGLRATR